MKKYLATIATQFKELFFRFPVATLFCVLTFLVFVGVIADSLEIREIEIQSAIMVLTLGYTLSLCAGIFAEDKEWKSWRKRIDVLVIPAMIGYFFLLIQNEEISQTVVICHYVLSLATASLLIIAPFSTTKSPIILWQYNVKILLQLLLATICAVIFFGGFALALLSIQILFDVSFSDRYFGYLAAFFFSLFLPLFFAAGIPTKAKICEIKNYPIFKIVGQYVLIPLLATYLVILYAYGFKILFAWELPNGLLSWLTLAFSSVGLLIFFMLHNLYVTRATKISTIFGKWFFFFEIPLLGLLFLAILRRVADYGFTESRYYLLLAACWLLGVTIYFILTKGRTVRPVIISFILVALLSIVGPWSAFSVSNKSQYNRLEKILAENDLLENGKFSNDATIATTRAVSRECEEILYFFAKREKVEYLQPLFTQDIVAIYQRYGRWSFAEAVFSNEEFDLDESSDFGEVFDVSEIDTSDYFSYSLNMEKEVLSMSGYDLFAHYLYYTWNENSQNDLSSAYIIKSKPNGIIEIYSDNQLSQTIDLKKAIEKIKVRVYLDDVGSYYSQEQLTIVEQDCKIVFKEISGDYGDKNPVSSAEMYIFWKK